MNKIITVYLNGKKLSLKQRFILSNTIQKIMQAKIRTDIARLNRSDLVAFLQRFMEDSKDLIKGWTNEDLPPPTSSK
jgi:hypothetical protein